MTAHTDDDTLVGTVWPSWWNITLAAVVGVWLIVVGMQFVVTWDGTKETFLLLLGGNALVATTGAWLSHLRWLATGNRQDRQIRNAYLPMAAYFLLRLESAAVAIPASVLRPADGLVWFLTQATAVTVLLLPIRDDTLSVGRGHRLWSGAAIAAAVATGAGVAGLQRIGMLADVQPLEVGLAVAFAAAAAMILFRNRGADRNVWFGVAVTMIASAHSVLAAAGSPYDSSVMWGLLLMGIALSTPIVGAIGENATRLLDQNALHDGLARLRRRTEVLLDTLPAIVFSVDRSRRLAYANRRARSFLNISVEGEEAQPGKWLDSIHADDRAQVTRAMATVLQWPGNVWEDVIRTDDPLAGVRWLSVRMQQIADSVSGQVLVQIVATEITDLFLAQQNAEQQQSRLAFLSNLGQSVAGEVEEERILERYLETGGQAMPMKALLLYRPLPGTDDLRLVAATGSAAEVFAHHRIQPLEGPEHPCRIAFQTGVPRAIDAASVVSSTIANQLETEYGIRHLSFLPLLAAGNVIGVLVAASDSRPRLAAEEAELMTQIGFLLGGTVYVAQLVRELNEQRAVAFEASRLKSEFLANTSHELRTPLTAILGFLRLVIDGTVADPDKQREYLTIAHDSAQKLLTIINDVLDLAKIEAGRLEVHHGPVPIRSVLEGVETLFKHQMKNKGIRFSAGSSAPGLVLWADPDRTTQILTNLLSNAMKFTPRQGAIDVDCVHGDGTITFIVADTGPGIPKADLDRVFASFVQVDGSTTREHGGTGLGLTISRRLAELMGGTLELESDGPGTGVTARLTLPEYHDQEPLGHR